MEWFEMQVGFHGDDKVHALRARLKNPLAECYVSRIYAHCYLQEKDRFPKDIAPSVLESAAEWRGKTGSLVAALLAVRFLEHDGEDLVVHGVAKRIARAHAFRQSAADRQQRWRERQRRRDEDADVTQPVDGRVTRDATVTSRVSNAGPTNQPTDLPIKEDAAPRPAAPEASERWPLGEQFRRLVSQGLGGMQNGGKGLAPLASAEDRDGLEADLRKVGADTAAAACLERARLAGKGRVSALAYFRGMVRDLAQPAAAAPRVTAPASPPAKHVGGTHGF